LLDGDDEVNGIKVGMAAEASAEVGFWIGCGVEFFASRAQESEVSLRGFTRPVEHLFDDAFDVDIVTKRS